MDRRTLNLGILAAAALPWVASPARALDLETALAPRILGDENAPITMIEYASLTCPHCAAFHNDVLPQIKTEYIDTGKVKLDARDFPLDRYALAAAALARAAAPNRYFGVLDLLFKQQRNWARGSGQDINNNLIKIARFAGMSEEDAVEAMTNQTLLDGILEQRLEGQRQYEVNSTPTFIINGTKLSGNQTFETFQDAFEDIIG